MTTLKSVEEKFDEEFTEIIEKLDFSNVGEEMILDEYKKIKSFYRTAISELLKEVVPEEDRMSCGDCDNWNCCREQIIQNLKERGINI